MGGASSSKPIETPAESESCHHRKLGGNVDDKNSESSIVSTSSCGVINNSSIDGGGSTYFVATKHQRKQTLMLTGGDLDDSLTFIDTELLQTHIATTPLPPALAPSNSTPSDYVRLPRHGGDQEEVISPKETASCISPKLRSRLLTSLRAASMVSVIKSQELVDKEEGCDDALTSPLSLDDSPRKRGVCATNSDSSGALGSPRGSSTNSFTRQPSNSSITFLPTLVARSDVDRCGVVTCVACRELRGGTMTNHSGLCCAKCAPLLNENEASPATSAFCEIPLPHVGLPHRIQRAKPSNRSRHSSR